jgi:4-amino-4-deoxy-L-arabinose transferase-like glycosyltransferase
VTGSLAGQPSRGRARLAVAAALALFLLAWFANLDYRHLIRTDEGRYAEIAREMVVSGDWVTPRQNDYKYFEKPPLQYWATAAAFEAFGLHEWTARLWTALCGLLGIGLTFLAGRRLWGAQTGALAAAILAGTLQWVAMGHFASLDMSLAALLSGALLAFCAAHGADPAASRQAGLPAGTTSRTSIDRRWLMAAWGLAALATLSKGIVAIALPGMTLTLYTLWRRDWRLALRASPLAGGALFLAITAPWFVLVARRNPEFVQFFFVQEHLSRFLTTMHGRDAPLWFFVPVLIAGLLPWTLALPAALRLAWPHRHSGSPGDSGPFEPTTLLGLWVVVTFVFFSLSHSKLESYLLPIYPALALLLARALPGLSRRAFAWLAGSSMLAGILIAIGLALMTRRGPAHIPAELLDAYRPWLVGAALALAAGGVAGWQLDRRARRLGAISALALGCFAGTQLALTGHESLSPLYSSYHVARVIRPLLTPEVPFYAVDTYDHTMPFYAGHTLIMVGYKDELAVPIEREPGPFLPDIASFEQAWRAAPRAFALMTPDRFDAFRQSGLPMTEVARDPRRVIVSTQ